jgi:hypothetical protein
MTANSTFPNVTSAPLLRVGGKEINHPSQSTDFRAIENVGAEECNGYLDYIIEFYHNLTDITVFMHDDGLIPYNTRKDSVSRHSPFYQFSQVAEATQRFLTPGKTGLDEQFESATPLERGFVHFGILEIKEVWGQAEYHGKAQKELWPFYATQENPQPPQTVTFKPSANMAVRKERILLRPLDVYRGLKRHVHHNRHITNGIGDARQYCCAPWNANDTCYLESLLHSLAIPW